MSIRIRAEHYLRCIIAGCLFFPAWAVRSQGLDEEKDVISQIMKIIPTAQEVTVTIVPPNWEAPGRVRGAELVGGCTFVTRDALRIASLVDLLRRTKLEIAKNTDKLWENEPREGIIMNLPKNNHISFKFGMKYLYQDEVRGSFTYSSHDEIFLVKADGSLPRNLYIWSSDTGSPVANQTSAKYFCGDFFNTLRNSK